MKLLHEVRHFPCDQWNYKTTNKDNFTGHMQSVHLGRQFSCDQYDYKAIDNDNHTAQGIGSYFMKEYEQLIY